MDGVSGHNHHMHKAHRAHHHHHARHGREAGEGGAGRAIGRQAKSLVAEIREAGVDLPRGARGVFASALAQGAEAQSLFEALTAKPAEPAPQAEKAEASAAPAPVPDETTAPAPTDPGPPATTAGQDTGKPAARLQASASFFSLSATQSTAAAYVSGDEGLAAFSVFSRTEITIVQASVAITGFAEAAGAIAPEAAAEPADGADADTAAAVPSAAPWMQDLTGAETALQLLQDAAA